MKKKDMVEFDLLNHPPIDEDSIRKKINKKDIVFANDQIVAKIKKEHRSTPTFPTTHIAKRGRKSMQDITTSLSMVQLPSTAIIQQKKYHPIGEVAKWFGITVPLLRLWENEFVQLSPRKNKKGDRFFSFEDIQMITLIYSLLYHQKYTMEGAKRYLQVNKDTLNMHQFLLQTLLRTRKFLLEIKAHLDI